MTPTNHDLPVLSARSLRTGYGSQAIIEDLTIDFVPGKVTAIIGPNACGKSTLLKTLCRVLRPQSGSVLLDDRPVHTIAAKRLARTIAMLPQSPIAPEGISVAELVGRGRHPHQGMMSRWSREDDAAVAEALEATSTAALSERPVDELSGGQRQRVWVAMVLAQHTDVLLLDEPTTYLDVSHQIDVLDLLTDLNRRRATTIVMVLHDLNLAARYADNLIVMSKGKVHSAGIPSEVFTQHTIEEVFELPNRVVEDPVSGSPMMVPIGRHFTS